MAACEPRSWHPEPAFVPIRDRTCGPSRIQKPQPAPASKSPPGSRCPSPFYSSWGWEPGWGCGGFFFSSEGPDLRSEVTVAGRLHHPGSLVGGGVEGFSGGLRPPGNKLLIREPGSGRGTSTAREGSGGGGRAATCAEPGESEVQGQAEAPGGEGQAFIQSHCWLEPRPPNTSQLPGSTSPRANLSAPLRSDPQARA